MNQGKFIAIEGPDGSGKGTQQKRLVERMTDSGLSVVTVDFPQYETSIFGKVIGEMLNNELGAFKDIHPKLASVLYAADRYKASDTIREALANGQHVIANRYTLSNMAHQSARLPVDERAAFIQYLLDLEYSSNGFGIPKPDLYIHLSLPVEVSQELLLQKDQRQYLKGAEKDAAESDFNHQIEAARMYHALSQAMEEITTINCCREDGALYSIEQIHELVWAEAQRTLFTEDNETLREIHIHGYRGTERNA